MLKAALDRVLDVIWRWTLRPRGEILRILGVSALQHSNLCVTINPASLWKGEPLRTKLRCLITNRWIPSEVEIGRIVKQLFLDQVFGGKNDFGEELLEQMSLLCRKRHDLCELTADDLIKARALNIQTMATNRRLASIRSNPPLNLQLALRSPALCLFIAPMSLKVPVVSIRYFVWIQAGFCFRATRQSKHPHADAIIACLYDVLCVQQKTATVLMELVELAARATETKGEALLTDVEIDAVIRAESAISYLKASIEKMVVLLGITHSIEHLDDKKRHKQRLDALKQGLPQSLQNTPYGQFILEFIGSDQLEELDRYRTGVLHKRGITELQPHSYAGVSASGLPLQGLFDFLHDQHAKNSAILLAVLAALADELVRRAPLDRDELEIAYEMHVRGVQASSQDPTRLASLATVLHYPCGG